VRSIATVAIHPYALRLVQPWRTAAGEVTRRRGWLVRVEDHAGRIGWGDHPAPLPDPGDETTGARLAALARPLRGLSPKAALARLVQSPTTIGVEGALLDLLAQQRDQPLRYLLSQTAAATVSVNAVATPATVAAAVADGFTMVKLKLGLAPWDEEVAALHRLTLPPGVMLRLDANQAWSWDEAVAVLEALADLPVDSVEEPLRGADPTQLAALQALTAIPLALDESFNPLAAESLLAARPVRRLVLKPARLGGLRATLALAHRVQQAGFELMVTSLVESAIGIAATASLTAALDPAARQVHGLATSSWLAEDVAPPLTVQAGRLFLTNRPGLGLHPSAGLTATGVYFGDASGL